MMKTVVMIPWKIKIGNNTIINEGCYLDGRGGLIIGNNVNIALNSMLITGTHSKSSPEFKFYTSQTIVENDVWIAASAIVLNGCTLKNKCIVGAGSVIASNTVCEANTVYIGIPAEKKCERNLTNDFVPNKWNIHFR